jgi:hypothetical protein
MVILKVFVLGCSLSLHVALIPPFRKYLVNGLPLGVYGYAWNISNPLVKT